MIRTLLCGAAWVSLMLGAGMAANAGEWHVAPAYARDATAVALSSDIKYAAAVTYRDTVFLWDLDSGERLWSSKVSGQQDHGLTFSPDGDELLVYGRWGTPHLFDARSGEQRQIFDARFESVLSGAFGPDPGQVSFLQEHGVLSVWDTRSGENVGWTAGKTQGVVDGALSPDARVAGVIDWEETAAYWQIGDQDRPVRLLQGHSKPPTWIVFSEDGGVAVTSGYDGTAMAFETETGAKLWHCGVHPFFARALAVSESAGRVLVEPAVGPAVLLDLANGDSTAYVDWQPRGVRAAAFSADGRFLLTAGGEGDLVLSRVEDGEVLQTLGGGVGSAEKLDMTADGGRLTVTDRWRKRWSWDLREYGVPVSGEAASRFPLRVPAPDGLSELVADNSSHFVQRALDDGTDLRTFVGHGAWIQDLAFVGPNLIASASRDGTVRLWDAATATTVAILVTKPGERWAVLAPDGRFDTGTPGRMAEIEWHDLAEKWNLDEVDPSRRVPGLLAAIVADHREKHDDH